MPWTIVICLIPIVVYILRFGQFALSENTADWGTFGDYIGGILNPITSFLTLLVTIYIAISINDYEKRKDEQAKKQDDIKAYLELYQYFTSAEFRQRRHTAWNVIRAALENENYRDFIIQETYVSRYTFRVQRKEVYEKFKAFLYTDKNLNKKEFLHKESEDRHMLDSLVNFYQMLAIKDIPENYYEICDFYYDSWRPLLIWYANELEKGYNSNLENRKFNNPPTLKKAIELLDTKYYNPVESDGINFENVTEHPILKWYINREYNK